jgi:ribonucleoside-diphosphate reductase beta chain
MKLWTDSKGVQVAPQETEVENYKVDSVKQNVNDVNFGDFKI